MRVEIAVPQVVDGAASATHDDCTRVEEKTCPNYSRNWRDRTGERRGQDRAEHTWKEEIVGADWLVKTNKFGIWDPRAG